MTIEDRRVLFNGDVINAHELMDALIERRELKAERERLKAMIEQFKVAFGVDEPYGRVDDAYVSKLLDHDQIPCSNPGVTPMAKQSQQLTPQRKALFNLGSPLDSAQVKGELDGLLHFSEGVALIFGQSGVNNTLGMAQVLVDNDELRDRVVADVNAWLGLAGPTANIPEPGVVSDEPQPAEEWAPQQPAEQS